MSSDPKIWHSPFESRWATREMLALLSDEERALRWRVAWVALAEAQAQLGVIVMPAQVHELAAQVRTIDFERIAVLEQETRHDVMAHIRAFGEVAPGAAGVIHLGATSCTITDNVDILLMRDALSVIADRLVALIEQLVAFAAAHSGVACLGFTHYQPAQPTTIGKRACVWLQDLALDLDSLRLLLPRLRLLGLRGATGTAATFVELCGGGVEGASRAKEMEVLFCQALGAEVSPLPISGQTLTRKLDTLFASLLGDILDSLTKMATDVRLMAHDGELFEPMEAGQVGSSAMPYKRNPMRCERICGIARAGRAMLAAFRDVHASQWLERTLDDSATRRIAIAELLLATDSALNLAVDVTRGLHLDKQRVAENLEEHLAKMATESILMRVVAKGGSRQEAHERIRIITRRSETASAEWRSLHPNADKRLMAFLRKDAIVGEAASSVANSDGRIDPTVLTGAAEQQALDFLANDMCDLLEQWGAHRGKFTPEVRV